MLNSSHLAGIQLIICFLKWFKLLLYLIIVFKKLKIYARDMICIICDGCFWEIYVLLWFALGSINRVNLTCMLYISTCHSRWLMAILMLILLVVCHWNPTPIFGQYIRSRCFLQLFVMNHGKKNNVTCI